MPAPPVRVQTYMWRASARWPNVCGDCAVCGATCEESAGARALAFVVEFVVTEAPSSSSSSSSEIVARLGAGKDGRPVEDGGRAAFPARCDGVGDGSAREELRDELVARFAREMRLQHGHHFAVEAAEEDAARRAAVRQHVETPRLELGGSCVGATIAAPVAAGAAGNRPCEALARGFVFVPLHHCHAAGPLRGDGREHVGGRAQAVERYRKRVAVASEEIQRGLGVVRRLIELDAAFDCGAIVVEVFTAVDRVVFAVTACAHALLPARWLLVGRVFAALLLVFVLVTVPATRVWGVARGIGLAKL